MLVVDVTNGGKRFCDEFRWDTRAPRDAPEALARRTCDDMGLPSPFDVAIAFALRRELLRVALGAVTAENTAAHQRTQLRRRNLPFRVVRVPMLCKFSGRRGRRSRN